jgi:diketogulonate reductase-like aldo/keto reductase
VAESRGIPMAQISLAWVLKNPVVTAAIAGTAKPHHLPDAVAALDVHLTDAEIRTLSSPTVRICRLRSNRPRRSPLPAVRQRLAHLFWC